MSSKVQTVIHSEIDMTETSSKHQVQVLHKTLEEHKDLFYSFFYSPNVNLGLECCQVLVSPTSASF